MATSVPRSAATTARAHGDQDRVVMLRGLRNIPAFEVGGRNGNVVTNSQVSTVHKGWRAIAVNGNPLSPADLERALRAARQHSQYTVTFFTGEDQKPDEDDNREALVRETARREAEEAELRRQAEEAERTRLEREAEERRRAAAAEEEADRARRRAEEAAAAAAQEAERAARRRGEEEARREEAAETERRRIACRAVEERLERTTGLPPRGRLEDPQQSLLKVLAQTRPAAPPKKKLGGPCDKCDGPHHEDDCPHFKGRKRDDHKDAWDSYGKVGKPDDDSNTGGEHVLRSARIVPQPGDGSCLFHSLAYGLKSMDASTLRADISDYIMANPDKEVAENPIKDWVLWDSGMDVRSYAQAMRTGSRWGGAIELAVCAQLKQAAVHVYERGSKGFTRISTFGSEGDRVIRLHYGGRVHYDALEA